MSEFSDSGSEFGRAWPVSSEAFAPLFVVGMNGSGTTMLLDSLGRHPDLYAFPKETREVPFLLSEAGRIGDFAIDRNFREYWELVLGRIAFVLANGGKPIPLPENWRDFPRDAGAVLDAVFRFFAAREGKVRWSEKTPQHVQHIEELSRVFPAARFIHIVRDGRDCAISVLRRYQRTPEYTVYRWKNVVRMGQKAGRDLEGRYFELRYEDITGAPEEWMRKICKFLEMPFHPDVLTSRRPRSVTAGAPGSVVGGIEPNSEKWRSVLTHAQLCRMERIGGRLLRQMGYAVECEPDGDRNPGRVVLAYWSWKDAASEFFNVLRKNILAPKRIRWSVIGRFVRVALRQRRMNRF